MSQLPGIPEKTCRIWEPRTLRTLGPSPGNPGRTPGGPGKKEPWEYPWANLENLGTLRLPSWKSWKNPGTLGALLGLENLESPRIQGKQNLENRGKNWGKLGKSRNSRITFRPGSPGKNPGTRGAPLGFENLGSAEIPRPRNLQKKQGKTWKN